ncbi:hypothetical protein PYW07_004809 [Mythimna separata]|uniref:Uncharacterized protein n=1 Tax=Mythimna separata TaxID=271217 RepID=A0AAD7YWE5_MYTSE|nr:hypothetical protein PYW07_004809 [Mythimna separata]
MLINPKTSSSKCSLLQGESPGPERRNGECEPSEMPPSDAPPAPTAPPPDPPATTTIQPPQKSRSLVVSLTPPRERETWAKKAEFLFICLPLSGPNVTNIPAATAEESVPRGLADAPPGAGDMGQEDGVLVLLAFLYQVLTSVTFQQPPQKSRSLVVSLTPPRERETWAKKMEFLFF